MGDSEPPMTPVRSGMRNRTPSGSSSSKALSDRFSTFTPVKGLKKSESDSDIQKRRLEKSACHKALSMSQSVKFAILPFFY